MSETEKPPSVKFKVGDRVRLKPGTGWDDLEGLSGVLIESDNDTFMHLEFDSPPADLDGYFPVVLDEIEHFDG